MTDRDRRAELIAAAVDDGLTAAESAELDALRAADPTIDPELEDLRRVVGRLSTLPDWDASAPPAALRDRVIRSTVPQAAAAEPAAPVDRETATVGSRSDPADPGERRVPRRRAWMLPVAAAACVLVGVGGTLAVQAVGSSGPSGPPGTLGAVEQVDFGGEDADVAVDGALVAHTWGTETVLEIDGLPAGDSYSVVVVAEDGTRFDTGTFLGSDVSIDCRMNAAVLREDVGGVRIEDAAGTVVAAAQVPDAS